MRGRLPTVALDVFEGPLDLLLHLIKRNEVDIRDIPIALITDQYLALLGELPKHNLDGAGEYLVMASTLMLIKSRMLLPIEAGEGQDVEEDPRAELVQQLLEYQRYREAAVALGDRPVLERDVFRSVGEALEAGAATDEPPVRDASVADLLVALRGVLERAKAPTPHDIARPGISVAECAQRVLARFALTRDVEFTALFEDDATRTEVIVTFLALLELMRLSVLRARQAEQFGTILITLAVADLATAAAMSRDVGRVEMLGGGGRIDGSDHAGS